MIEGTWRKTPGATGPGPALEIRDGVMYALYGADRQVEVTEEMLISWGYVRESCKESPESPLERELAALLNKYSAENESNTPDFILARYMMSCLDAFEVALNGRARWYGRMDEPGKGSVPFDPTRPK